MSTCDSCAAGTYSSAAGSTSCASCAAGTYSGLGASACTSCAAGTYSGLGASACTSCAANTYSAAGASSCSECTRGFYSAGNASSCSPCNVAALASKYKSTYNGTNYTYTCDSGHVSITEKATGNVVVSSMGVTLAAGVPICYVQEGKYTTWDQVPIVFENCSYVTSSMQLKDLSKTVTSAMSSVNSNDLTQSNINECGVYAVYGDRISSIGSTFPSVLPSVYYR
jgi:hypothetical protein